MQAIYYSACCAFDLGKSFSHRKKADCLWFSRIFHFAQKFLHLFLNDLHGPFLSAVDLCDACLSSNEGLH